MTVHRTTTVSERSTVSGPRLDDGLGVGGYGTKAQ